MTPAPFFCRHHPPSHAAGIINAMPVSQNHIGSSLGTENIADTVTTA